MDRRPLRFIAALSLVLCISLCVLWARSGREGDTWYFVRDMPQDPPLDQVLYAQHNWILILSRNWTFAWESKDWFRWHHRQLTLPYALPVMLSTILPLWWAWRALASLRRKKAGHCVVCGYDLRASPGRCPECGTMKQGAIV